jgi:hypothetical protein
VSNFDGSLDANPQEASARLSEGLKSCRTVLESYRSMLAGQWLNGEYGADPPEALNDNED